MPELPEVETVVRGLNKHIIGQTIRDVEILHKKSFQSSPSTSLPTGQAGSGSKKLRGLKIKEITRRGKGIIINLSKDISLLAHLKMTGQLIYVPHRHAEFSSASKNKILKRVQDDGDLVQDDKRLNFGHPTR